MALIFQQSIASAVNLQGQGLFSGVPVQVEFRPAPPNQGVVFIRSDVTVGGMPVRIPALASFVRRAPRRTTLASGPATIDTCEHCLSAIAGLGIDNITVAVSGPELPGGDGSANLFVDVLKSAGIIRQEMPRRVIHIGQPITIRENDTMVAALPSDEPGMQILYDLDYGPSGHIPRQAFSFRLHENPLEYEKQIAHCRTFALEHEAQAIQQAGMGKHLSPDIILVIGPNGPLGANRYRFDNEPVRHKVLDLIGDLALAGASIQGRIIACKSGHHMNHRLAARLIQHVEDQRRTSLVNADGIIDIRKIQRILPHRYPMLLVDRVLELQGEERAVGIKNVSMNELFFQGHYPGTPIMPGVLIVEAMAQLSGILLSRKLEHTGKLAVLLSMDKVKLRKPVTPGDQLILEAVAVRVKARTGHTRCRAYVLNQLAAEAEIKFMLVDAEQE